MTFLILFCAYFVHICGNCAYLWSITWGCNTWVHVYNKLCKINRIFYMIFPSRWEQGLETYQVGQRPQSPWWSQECQKTDLFPVSLLSDWELLPRGHMSLLDWDWEARGHLVISRGLTHSLSSLSLSPVSALNLRLHGSLFPRLLHTEALPSPSYVSTCDSIVNSLMLTLCGLRTSFFTFMRPESKATG